LKFEKYEIKRYWIFIFFKNKFIFLYCQNLKSKTLFLKNPNKFIHRPKLHFRHLFTMLSESFLLLKLLFLTMVTWRIFKRSGFFLNTLQTLTHSSSPILLEWILFFAVLWGFVNYDNTKGKFRKLCCSFNILQKIYFFLLYIHNWNNCWRNKMRKFMGINSALF